MNNVMNLREKGNKNIFNDKLLRARDLSEIFINTSQATFDNWVRAGLLHRHKICGGVYYKLSEVRQLIDNSVQYSEVR